MVHKFLSWIDRYRKKCVYRRDSRLNNRVNTPNIEFSPNYSSYPFIERNLLDSQSLDGFLDSLPPDLLARIFTWNNTWLENFDESTGDFPTTQMRDESLDEYYRLFNELKPYEAYGVRILMNRWWL